jgi:hypothetical protein
MSEPADEGKPAPIANPSPKRQAGRNAASAWSQDAYAPLITEGSVVDALGAKLAAIAVGLGYPPEAQQIMEVQGAGFHRALLDPNVNIVRLVSPIFHAEGDERRLGVAIADVQLDGESIPLTDLRLQQGFHDIETGRALRWTDGNAYLVLDPVPSVRVLRLRVAAGKPEQS